MLLDLNKLHGPREEVVRRLQPEALGSSDPDYRVVAPVDLSMVVAKSGNDAFDVTGRVKTTLELECSRCLDAYQFPVDAEFELRYVPQPGPALNEANDAERTRPRSDAERTRSDDVRTRKRPDDDDEVEREIGEDDLGTAYYRDGVLDLGELVREQFQLALPMKPLCSDACRGLCPQCGVNHNRTECGCQTAWEDPRLAPLKSLLNRPKEN
jgi:uncharacterized protein